MKESTFLLLYGLFCFVPSHCVSSLQCALFLVHAFTVMVYLARHKGNWLSVWELVCLEYRSASHSSADGLWYQRIWYWVPRDVDISNHEIWGMARHPWTWYFPKKRWFPQWVESKKKSDVFLFLLPHSPRACGLRLQSQVASHNAR